MMDKITLDIIQTPYETLIGSVKMEKDYFFNPRVQRAIKGLTSAMKDFEELQTENMLDGQKELLSLAY